MSKILMMIACALLALGASTAMAGSCDTILGCGATGATCGQVSNTTTENWCEASSLCMTSSPGATSYVCVDGNSVKGRACSTDNDCQPKGFTLGTLQYAMYSKCISSVCSTNVLYPNDYCTVGSDCKSGSCDSNGRCAGNSTGLACSSSSDCNAGNICRGSVCQLQVDAGGNCTLSGSFCKAADSCSNTDVCVRDFSIGAGGSCGSDDNCAADLTCSGNTCALNTATVGATCNSDSECGNGDCTCNYVSGTEYCESDVNRCTNQVLSYEDCMVSNNCHTDSNPLQENSCARRNCYTRVYDYLICANGIYNRTAYPGACFAGLASPAAVVEASIFSLIF